jgi:hypothetical protein
MGKKMLRFLVPWKLKAAEAKPSQLDSLREEVLSFLGKSL